MRKFERRLKKIEEFLQARGAVDVTLKQLDPGAVNKSLMVVIPRMSEALAHKELPEKIADGEVPEGDEEPRTAETGSIIAGRTMECESDATASGYSLPAR